MDDTTPLDLLLRGSGDAPDRPNARRAVRRLSERERDVLAASARGCGVSEVASELRLPADEVRAIISAAMRKLGAGSKLKAVIIALRRGDIVP